MRSRHIRRSSVHKPPPQTRFKNIKKQKDQKKGPLTAKAHSTTHTSPPNPPHQHPSKTQNTKPKTSKKQSKQHHPSSPQGLSHAKYITLPLPMPSLHLQPGGPTSPYEYGQHGQIQAHPPSPGIAPYSHINPIFKVVSGIFFVVKHSRIIPV